MTWLAAFAGLFAFGVLAVALGLALGPSLANALERARLRWASRRLPPAARPTPRVVPARRRADPDATTEPLPARVPPSLRGQEYHQPGAPRAGVTLSASPGEVASELDARGPEASAFARSLRDSQARVDFDVPKREDVLKGKKP